ncbi:hypothetical protein JCM6882_000674 [Rhodosporidiobolus microsporus]
MSLITHFVAFKYKADVSEAERHLIASRFSALQDQCVHNGNWYVTVQGGRQISPEQTQASEYHHAWTVTFNSTEERDFYLHEDPAHNAFREFVGDKLESSFVFDLRNGEF